MPNKPRPSTTKPKGFTLRPLPEESAALEGGDPETLSVREPFENLGDLPHGYGVDTIFLIAQEPHWLFTYWDIDIARHPGGAAYLRYHTADGVLEGEIEVPFETRNWYVPVQKADADYYVEIGFYRANAWNLIARSVAVTTPPEGMASSDAFEYATVPFHLTFQRMLDHLSAAQGTGEDLMSAISRLQQKGDFSAFGTIGIPDLLSDDQRSLLQALLGPALLTELASSGQSSGEIEARIRAFLEEQLNSGGASEALNSFRDSAALFSGGILSSAGISTSWEVAALASWAAGAITSWSTSGQGVTSWGDTTSWSAAETAAVGGETSWTSSIGGNWAKSVLSSWGETSAGASWLQGIQSSGNIPSSGIFASLSSWLQGGQSSWLQGAQSSWLQGVQSSWAQAALTSWTSAEVSSWFSAAATTSWSGASETLSSFGTERGFFMHVNAEVIFYGGTDPRAKVTVDGKPIALDANGTFRYHFVFPNSDYEIPIVAESPDGVENRSATLRFTRSTQKVGHVTDTSQPPLGAPMGEIAP